MKKTLFFCAAALSLLSGCSSMNDNEEFMNVPDFEVRNIRFTAPGSKKSEKEKEYIRKWTILGPVEPEGKSVKDINIENENLLCGFQDAPDDAFWHVKVFIRTKQTIPGICDFTDAFRKYAKKSVFYACTTLKSEKEYKNVTFHVRHSGDAQIYWNGKLIYTNTENPVLEKEIAIPGQEMRQGWNRLVFKYRDRKVNPEKRAVSVRFTIPEKDGSKTKHSLIQ